MANQGRWRMAISFYGLNLYNNYTHFMVAYETTSEAIGPFVEFIFAGIVHFCGPLCHYFSWVYEFSWVHATGSCTKSPSGFRSKFDTFRIGLRRTPDFDWVYINRSKYIIFSSFFIMIETDVRSSHEKIHFQSKLSYSQILS